MSGPLSPSLPPEALRQIPVLTLAYLGDAVYELMTRSRLAGEGAQPGRLNAAALDYVAAPAQCRALRRLLPLLSEEEAAVFRRARNARVSNIPHGATPEEYHAATGLEALFGWLWLSGLRERAEALFVAAFPEGEG